MARSGVNHLWEAARPALMPAVRQYDFWFGMVGCVGATFLAICHPPTMLKLTTFSTAIAGVLLSVVLTGLSLQVGLFDERQIRDLNKIGQRPLGLLAPTFLTAALAVVSLILLGLLNLCTPCTSPWLRVPLSGASALFVTWTLFSLFAVLAMVAQVIELRTDEAIDTEGEDD
jgi:hypothetical protein